MMIRIVRIKTMRKRTEKKRAKLNQDVDQQTGNVKGAEALKQNVQRIEPLVTKKMVISVERMIST